MSGGMYRLRDDALMSVEADDELVALDTRTSRYLAVNASGRGLWQRLTTGASEAELVAQLVDTYAIDNAAATRDVRSFLGDLEKAGLLV